MKKAQAELSECCVFFFFIRSSSLEKTHHIFLLQPNDKKILYRDLKPEL